MESLGRDTAFCTLASVALYGLMVAAFYANAATTVTVGGDAGWSLGHFFGTMTISRGDTLNFRYSAAHNVYEVSSNDYSSCQTGNPSNKYFSGDDYVTLYNSGTYYFICGIPGHCDSGMKVLVNVQ